MANEFYCNFVLKGENFNLQHIAKSIALEYWKILTPKASQIRQQQKQNSATRRRVRLSGKSNICSTRQLQFP